MAKELVIYTMITMSLSLLSKGLGFLRDILLVSKLGAGEYTDAYYGAMNIVDFFILFSGLNALKSVATSNYTQAHSSKTNRNLFFTSMVSGVSVYGLILSAAIFLFSPLLVKLFLPGLTDAVRGQSETYLKVLAFLVFFRSLYFILGNILAVEKKFISQNIFMPLINLSILASIWFLPSDKIMLGLIHTLVWGTLVAVIIQMIILSPKCRVLPSLLFNKLNDVWSRQKFFAKKTAPLLFVTATFALASSTDKIIASFFEEGALTSINIASMISLLPLQFVVIPMGNVLFPHFSKLYNEGKTETLSNHYNFNQNLLISIFIPIAVFLFFNSTQIISLAFLSDKFNTDDVDMVAQNLSIYSIALVFNAFYYITSFLFQGAQKNSLIGKIGFYGYIINIICSVLFSFLLDSPIGIPMGTTVAFAFFAIRASSNIKKEFSFSLNKKIYLNSVIVIATSILTQLLIGQINIPSFNKLMLLLTHVCIYTLIHIPIYFILVKYRFPKKV